MVIYALDLLGAETQKRLAIKYLTKLRKIGRLTRSELSVARSSRRYHGTISNAMAKALLSCGLEEINIKDFEQIDIRLNLKPYDVVIIKHKNFEHKLDSGLATVDEDLNIRAWAGNPAMYRIILKPEITKVFRAIPTGGISYA